jgi:RNA polymerase sigma-70 factor (ECF subfamily)
MSDDLPFRDLVRRLRAGDEQAHAELVRRYEPVIRRIIRVRMRDPRLNPLFDSADVCQSVLKSFFVRTALGQFDLDQPDQLRRLLAQMARHKLADQVDRQAAGRRDYRRVIRDSAAPRQAPDPADSPSEQVAAAELLQEARRRLSAHERCLLELRQQGLEWAAIAARLGGTPEALRVQLRRAQERVARQLGLVEVPHE